MLEGSRDDRKNEAGPAEERLPSIRLGFQWGLGDSALLLLGVAIVLGAVAYWVVGLYP